MRKIGIEPFFGLFWSLKPNFWKIFSCGWIFSKFWNQYLEPLYIKGKKYWMCIFPNKAIKPSRGLIWKHTHFNFFVFKELCLQVIILKFQENPSTGKFFQKFGFFGQFLTKINFFLETPCGVSNVPSLIKIHFFLWKSVYTERGTVC